jgi:hypothetical protein
VRKIEQLARSLHLSATGNSFGVITALLILAAALACAAEPILTLAPVRDPQPQKKTFVATYGDLLSGTDALFFDFNLKDGKPEMTGLQDEILMESSSNIRLEKQANPDARDSFQLVHENLTDASRLNMSFSLQAGYGRIWGEKSMLQKISADYQEPGCAYVSADFSF